MKEYIGENGEKWRQLKDITVKDLIFAGARDEDAEYLVSEYGLTFKIPLEGIIDYASSYSDRLQWLLDRGFIERVVEDEWKISIHDGYSEFQYPIRISNEESIDSVYSKIRMLFGDKERKGTLSPYRSYEYR